MRHAPNSKLLKGIFLIGLAWFSVCLFASADEPFALLSPTNAWKYNDESIDLGTDWIAPNYDDSAWSNGIVAIGFGSANNPNEPLPAPNVIRTIPRKSTPTNANRNIITFYFRTHFTLTNDPGNLALTASNLIDDGAIFYVNGREVNRVAMPEGAASWGTTATRNDDIGTSRTPTSSTHGYDIFAIPEDALVQGDNVMAVEVHQANSASSDMVFQTELWAGPGAPPVIGTQPEGATVYPGTNITLSVSLANPVYAGFQWFQNGSPLAAATNKDLILTNVLVAQTGGYFVEISNSYGMVTSSVAGLTVVEGGVRLPLMEFTNVWRFDQSGSDLGTAWRAPNYDDSSWLSSPGVLLNSPSEGFPEPTNRVLSLTNNSGAGIITYYFRTHFAVPPDMSHLALVASILLDDGAIFYVNGSETARLRLTGNVTVATTADYSPTQGLSYETMLLAPTNLVPGDNVLAVEVHQYSVTSPDVVFGMNLRALAAFDQPLVLLSPPLSQTVDEELPAAFDAEVFGAQPVVVQWFHNGVPIPDETNTTLTIGVAHPSHAGSYFFVASNAVNTVTGAVATLSVTPDLVPPTLVTAYGTNGIVGLVVVFSDPVAPQSATNAANYWLSSTADVLVAQLIAPETVLLTTSGLGPQFDYTLWVTNVSDLADTPNFLPPNSAVPVRPNRSSLADGVLGVQTVFMIVMENKTWSDIRGNTNCPYLNSLLPQASYCENYTSPNNVHPSEPNYIWFEAGDDFGFRSDHGPAIDRIGSTNHLVTQLFQAGIEWRGYMESLPYGRTGTNDGPYEYLARHNPFAYFDDITTNYDYCTNHIRPYAEFPGDLAAGRVGRYNFITPNRYNDMHDALPESDPISQGDDWLASELPRILNSAAFSNNGAIFITFDENDLSDDHAIPMIVLSPLAKGGGYASYAPYDHSSTLRTMQEIFGVRPFLGGATFASPLNDLFKSVSLTPVVSNGVFGIRIDIVLPGRTNYLQTSSNLITWTTINTNAATNSITIPDPDAVGARQKFYRLIEQR